MVTTFRMLVYLGIVLPLKMVWVLLRYTAIALVWIVGQIRVGEEVRELHLGER